MREPAQVPAPARVRRLQPERRMASIRNILVPFDGSPPAIAALQHAVALAEDSTGTRIDLLHVKAPDEFEVGSMAPSAPQARKEAELAMEAALAQARQSVGD